MPVTKSAKKALRTSTKKRDRNYKRRATVKSSLKSLEEAIASKVEKNIKAAMSAAMSQIDRARKAGVLPVNTANRRKAKVASLVRRGAAGEAAPVKKQTKTVAKKKPAAKKTDPKKPASKKAPAKKK